jgi:hypothetical protein
MLIDNIGGERLADEFGIRRHIVWVRRHACRSNQDSDLRPSWAQRRAGSNPVILPLSRPENDGDKLALKGGAREFGFYIDKQKNRNILLLDRQAVSMLTA